MIEIWRKKLYYIGHFGLGKCRNYQPRPLKNELLF
jgi:hypothetical protein